MCLYCLTLEILKKLSLTPETKGSNGSPVKYHIGQKKVDRCSVSVIIISTIFMTKKAQEK